MQSFPYKNSQTLNIAKVVLIILHEGDHGHVGCKHINYKTKLAYYNVYPECQLWCSYFCNHICSELAKICCWK